MKKLLAVMLVAVLMGGATVSIAACGKCAKKKAGETEKVEKGKCGCSKTMCEKCKAKAAKAAKGKCGGAAKGGCKISKSPALNKTSHDPICGWGRFFWLENTEQKEQANGRNAEGNTERIPFQHSRRSSVSPLQHPFCSPVPSVQHSLLPRHSSGTRPPHDLTTCGRAANASRAAT